MAKDSLEQYQDTIGHVFEDQELLAASLSHSSACERRADSNERLEFLGDAVLDLIVSDFLYKTYPKKREGHLTQLRSSLVNKVSLAKQAEQMDLGDYMLLSTGEARSGGRHRGSILADAYESIIGALYLDGGTEPIRKFLVRTLLKNVEQFDTLRQWMNYKSVLLEYTQGNGKGQPRYRVESEEGPDHNKVFEVAAYLKTEQIASGTGSSKQEAQEAAARAALELEEWK